MIMVKVILRNSYRIRITRVIKFILATFKSDHLSFSVAALRILFWMACIWSMSVTDYYQVAQVLEIREGPRLSNFSLIDNQLKNFKNKEHCSAQDISMQ